MLLFATAFSPIWADTVLSDVVASQRWPWSEKVDVDFTLTGDASDVDVHATWDALRGDAAPGVTNWVRLGTAFACAPGPNRFTWDPSASPQSGTVLTGFTVKLTPRTAAADTYLVVNLETGGYTFLAEAPVGGWGDAYKTTKMVFRRIPSGGNAYTLGMSANELSKWYGASSGDSYKNEKRTRGTRTQSFTSDFYMAVFQMTEAQYDLINLGTVGSSLLPKTISYDTLRGATNAADGICWPATQYAVGSSSTLHKLRACVGSGLTVDLPTEEQWETALRAGTTSVFPNGGTTANTDDELWAIHGQSAGSYTNGVTALQPVGQRNADNVWGLYDMLGNRPEWTLDVWYVDGYGRATAPTGRVDSVGYAYWREPGPTTSASNATKIRAAFGQRVVRSAFPIAKGATVPDVLPSYRTGAAPSAWTTCTARFCIHLKPLGFSE